MRSTLWILLVFCHYEYVFSDACNETIVLEDTAMNLTSPGYPRPYHNNENCWWKIESNSSADVIGVQVAFMDVEWSQLCMNDKIVFYDGLRSAAPILTRRCGNGEQRSVVSSGNVMFISFTTDTSYIGRGFVLTIIAYDRSTTCGGNLAASSTKQPLELPLIFPFLPWNKICSWTISAENENDTIDITSNLGHDVRQNLYHCLSGFITFYNGNTTNASAIISSYCQKNAVPYIRSSLNMMRIVFQVGALTKPGLELTYRSVPATNCSRTIVATPINTFLMSPGYPDAYYNDLNCVIRIASALPYIRIETLSVDMEGSTPQCDSDSLTFYNDLSLNTKQLTFCGKPSPRVIYSTGNTMAIQFRTDSNTVKQGFRLMVTSALDLPHVTHCGNTSLIATSEPQYLTSPDYPRDYHNNDQCIWNITAANGGMKIRFVLEDTHIESSSLPNDVCTYDYLKAFDGYISESSLFMTVCGVSQPVAQSRSSHVKLVFMADSTTTEKGFKLKYFQTNDTYLCGGHVHADKEGKWITTPNWPGYYPSNQDCRWTVEGPRNTNLNLSAEVFDVEYSSNCAYDYVKIYDGLESIPPYTTRLCGSDLYNYVSSGNSLTIIFHSDNSRTRRGFKYRARAGHFTLYNSRTQDLYASYLNDAITSPNYPFNYPSNALMTWKIDSSGKNYRVTVSFETESVISTSCYRNYVEVFDGSSSSATSLGKFCGADTSSKTSSGRYMFLKFKSGSSSGPGFKLTYSKEYHFASDDYSTTNVGPIIGGIIGGIAVIFIIIIIIGSITSKRNQGPTVRTVQQNNMYTISSRALEEPTPATFMPPPSYTVATAGDGANNNPPAYSEVALHYKNNS